MLPAWCRNVLCFAPFRASPLLHSSAREHQGKKHRNGTPESPALLSLEKAYGLPKADLSGFAWRTIFLDVPTIRTLLNL